MKRGNIWILSLFVLFPLMFIPLKLGAAVKEIPPSSAHKKSVSYHIAIENGKLSMDVREVSPSKVLATIEKKTGVEFQVEPSISKILIDKAFSNVPLLEGIRMIVYPSNLFCIFSGQNDKLEKVIILPVQVTSHIEDKKTKAKKLNEKKMMSRKVAAKKKPNLPHLTPSHHPPPFDRDQKLQMPPPSQPPDISLKKSTSNGPEPMPGTSTSMTGISPPTSSNEGPPIEESDEGPVQ